MEKRKHEKGFMSDENVIGVGPEEVGAERAD